MLLDVTSTQTVTPRRPVDEENNTFDDLTPIDIVVFLNDPSVVETPQGKRYTQTGVIRTPRGVDLQDGDEIDLPEGTFGVVGADQRNRNHSLTGADFGWARFSIRKGG